ncbi:hypothetical protein F8M41_026139 [Gigaspora margarita]|uniref:Uncharacterized protein n=1 Tax=Gigaspora margarita TaxID=4874 RepID=A0A8H3XI25_GIGMA|nr:hypothetical protein F8M41_026139 [Gigaspora margarita]
MLSTDFINEFSEFKHYKGCFSYKNDNIYVIHIDDNVRVKIERITFDVARIYFTDKQGQQIPAPPNTILRNLMVNQNEPIHNNCFYITWITNYAFLRNGVEIFRLENQKHHVVKGELELVTEVIEQ